MTVHKPPRLFGGIVKILNALLLISLTVFDSPARAAEKNPNILAGLDIEARGSKVVVSPGSCRIGGETINVAEPTVLDVPPAESVAAADEKYTLSSEKPDRWLAGTHLKGCLAAYTTMPNCLVRGSVIVKLADGTVMRPDKDYLIDEKWAALGRVEGGGIAKDAQVSISYRIGHMRLDSIVVTPAGVVSLARGQAKLKDVAPPAAPKDSLVIANVFLPASAEAVEAWQVFPVIEPVFPEPDDAETARRAALVPKTLAKLRAGEPVTIVAWGDSVTYGGDASEPARRFPDLFARLLGERFPKSKISLVNAGVGGTATPGRLPALQHDVLDHHPDLVTIEFVNDMGREDDVVRANYPSAFKQIRDAGAEVILITPHFTMPTMMKKPHPRGDETRHTVDLLRELAAAHHVPLADTSRRWAHLEKEGIPYVALLDNGINHPDDRGHKMFVQDLMSFFPAVQ